MHCCFENWCPLKSKRFLTDKRVACLIWTLKRRSVKTVTAEGTAAISMWSLISFCVVPALTLWLCLHRFLLRKKGGEKSEGRQEQRENHYLELHPPSIYLLWDVRHTTYSCRHMFTHLCANDTVNEGGPQLKDDSFRGQWITSKNISNTIKQHLHQFVKTNN